MTLTARPIYRTEARAWIWKHHRHNVPPTGWLGAVAILDDGRLCGVGTLGRPNAPALQDGVTAEVTRCCTDGTKNAASMIYGRLCRAAAAFGYTSVVTSTLASEPGSSLRAAGFVLESKPRARDEWVRSEGSMRYQQDLFGDDRRPTEPVVRWRRQLVPA